tara:strand:+ start:109 stop:669 length:561 start_codon:yes stop_codon:yes gene_type:complete
MKTKKLIIFNFKELYHIFKELSLELNFEIIEISNEVMLNKDTEYSSNYLIISKDNKLNLQNQIIIENFPIKLSKLVEKINIEFLKIQFSNQSQIKINQYIINLNSREMILDEVKLKLTEKEVNTIVYLSNTKNPVSINKLEEIVWKYQSDIETHTVETHIYRLRKKISQSFGDNKFIISKKNGYQI